MHLALMLPLPNQESCLQAKEIEGTMFLFSPFRFSSCIYQLKEYSTGSYEELVGSCLEYCVVILFYF